jgi:hypothetical protein
VRYLENTSPNDQNSWHAMAESLLNFGSMVKRWNFKENNWGKKSKKISMGKFEKIKSKLCLKMTVLN